MYEWNLKAFYPSFSDDLFEQDVNKLFELTEKVINFYDNVTLKATPTQFLESLLKEEEELKMIYSRLFAFINLTMSANTLDVEAKKALVRLQPISSKFALLDSKFKSYIKSIDNLDEIINQSAYLKQYEFIIKEDKEAIMHTMSEDLEVLTSELSQNGSNLWSQLQRHLTSVAEIEFRGKKLSLSEIRNLAYSNDPSIRKEGYEKELEIYQNIEDAVSFAISGIKGQVNTLSKRRNFESVLAEALVKSRMKQETLDALIGAMKANLHIFHKYLTHKAKLLGHKNGLPWYDLFAPMGKSEKQYTIEEAQKFILKQFGTFSDELKGLAKKAFDNNWIDYLPRKGKVGGAFCMNSRPIKESRILSNFGGEIGDVITLAHELGHAYHGEQIFKEAPMNNVYTMPVAETASTLCETISKTAAYNEANSKEEKIYILEQELQDSTQVIVDIYSRFLFEQSVFDARLKTIPSAKDLNELMISAQKAAYGDSLDHDLLNSGMWINKSHYYRGALSFYNFPYAFGLLFAKGIYAKYLEEGSSFVEKVNQLLRATGRMSVEDVAMTIDIDLSKPEFWEAGLATINNSIEEFIRLTSE